MWVYAWGMYKNITNAVGIYFMLELCPFNPLAHDNISNHRISMKLLTQVKGQNTTHFFSWPFLILSTRSGVIGHCSNSNNLKKPLKAYSIEFDTCSNKMTPKDHLAASTTWKCWSLKALSNEPYPSPVNLLITFPARACAGTLKMATPADFPKRIMCDFESFCPDFERPNSRQNCLKIAQSCIQGKSAVLISLMVPVNPFWAISNIL